MSHSYETVEAAFAANSGVAGNAANAATPQTGHAHPRRRRYLAMLLAVPLGAASLLGGWSCLGAASEEAYSPAPAPNLAAGGLSADRNGVASVQSGAGGILIVPRSRMPQALNQGHTVEVTGNAAAGLTPPTRSVPAQPPVNLAAQAMNAARANSNHAGMLSPGGSNSVQAPHPAQRSSAMRVVAEVFGESAVPDELRSQSVNPLPERQPDIQLPQYSPVARYSAVPSQTSVQMNGLPSSASRTAIQVVPGNSAMASYGSVQPPVPPAPGLSIPAVPVNPSVSAGPVNGQAIQDGTSSVIQHVPAAGSPAAGSAQPLLSSNAAANSVQPGHVVSVPSGHSLVSTVPGMSGFRATTEADAPVWMAPYHGRVDRSFEGTSTQLIPNPAVVIPGDYTAWWDASVRNQAGIAPTVMPIDVTRLVSQAMTYSPQVLALQSEPEVQQRVVLQEEATFDWRAFLESKYNDVNDPVGNTLTTGNGDSRFRDFRVNGSAGLKRRTELGGEVEISEKFGHQYNNSNFLVPNGQSTARLELSFRQPLLSRGGTWYAQNQIVQARINANISNDEVVSELQNHLYKVTEAYWQLYRARAEYFQRQKLVRSAHEVLATLEAREQVDTIARQVLRARAAVSRAEATMQRAVTSIRNAESQLRLLVNDPRMLDGGPLELMPTESPMAMEVPVTLRNSLQTALTNRSDISRAIRQMRAAGVRLGVSQNEMLPRLDFIVSSYVAGLAPDAKLPNALGSQFSEGRPGFGVGLEFEVPIGNRAARAKMEQRQWELKRSINVFRATVEASLTEVEVANREVDTAYREMLGRYQAMVAAQTETAYLQDRFRVLPMAESSAILLLEDLLDSFERLADSESAFVEAQVNYSLSIIQLRKATGVLLVSRHDSPSLKADELGWVNERIQNAGPAGDIFDAADELVIPPARSAETAEPERSTPATPTSWFRGRR
ncbi:MAG: TolC family protein [Planctomycetaceae bacterium]|nr:TolC family protein [Planctomycetaceae bacterium]